MRVNRTVTWRAGEGTPIKYTFTIDANLDIVSIQNNIATLRLNGSVILENHPTNSRNSFAASDFAVLLPGDKDMGGANFNPGTQYYQAALPCLPNTSPDYQASVLCQFRGDTWISDPTNNRNKVSLYYNGGMAVNQVDTETTIPVAIDITYTCPVSQGGNPALIWYSSGADNATTYNWLSKQVWVTWAELDYRPGASWDGTTWQSHNRSNGACDIYNGSSYVEMRTANGPDATDNPPHIRHADGYHNMRKIGANG